MVSEIVTLPKSGVEAEVEIQEENKPGVGRLIINFENDELMEEYGASIADVVGIKYEQRIGNNIVLSKNVALNNPEKEKEQVRGTLIKVDSALATYLDEEKVMRQILRRATKNLEKDE